MANIKGVKLQETVILAKGELVAMIAVITNDEGGEVLTYDSRDSEPKFSSFPTFDDTELGFNEALYKSQLRGWRIVHRGEPNIG